MACVQLHNTKRGLVAGPSGPCAFDYGKTRIWTSWVCTSAQHNRKVRPNHLACQAVSADTDHAVTRRQALAALVAASQLQAGFAFAQEGFKTYSNKSDRYQIEYPSAWKETSKSGASILLQDPARKSTTVGVTVTPVRIAKLEDIGDPAAVAEKLILAEKAKESTKSVELLNQSQRKGSKSGTLMYDLEYELDSTRGRKRFLSTVAVKDKKLYIVNGTFKCGEELCNDAQPTVKIMQAMLNSFDISTS